MNSDAEVNDEGAGKMVGEATKINRLPKEKGSQCHAVERSPLHHVRSLKHELLGNTTDVNASASARRVTICAYRRRQEEMQGQKRGQCTFHHDQRPGARRRRR